MKLKKITRDAEIEFCYEELLLLNAALNEVCNGIDVLEFETRIGASKRKVKEIMGGIQSVIDQIDKINEV